jgi:hypothetical protein
MQKFKYVIPHDEAYKEPIATMLDVFSAIVSCGPACYLVTVLHFNLWCVLFVPEGFQDIPSSLKYSRLQFYYPHPKGLPKTFAWLTEPGIFYGQVSVFKFM